jgi:hypothetical protein
MGRIRSIAVFTALCLGGAAPAFAGAGEITTTVTPLTDNVTYSSLATSRTPALDTFVGYLVSVRSDASTTNTINNVVFTATTTVTEPDEAAEFSSADGITCTATAPPAGSPPNARSIRCAIGQLRAGEAYPPFAVFFKAPVADPSGPPPEDDVQFSGITYYGEGTGGEPQSTPDNSTDEWNAADVRLGTPNPTLIKSAVSKDGGTLFTGTGVSTSTIPFVTSVKIPPAQASYTTATIAVNPTAPAGTDPDCVNFTTCYLSQLTIPGTFDPSLSIVLRQDASTIKPGTKIGSVIVRYFPDAGGAYVVGLCASPTTPRSDGLPCIAESIDYKNRKAPGWTPELDGDFEWRLLNRNNGGYIVD